MKPFYQTITLLLLLAIIIVFAYWNLPKTFFQQDEWWSFGTMIAAGQQGGILRQVIDLTLESAKVHVVPIATLFQIALFNVFYLSFSGYAFFDIVMHILNAGLVFFLAESLLQKRVLSFFTALAFALASIPHQAVSWFAAAIIVQGATFFSLLSIISMLLYLKNPSKSWYAYCSFFALLCALFFNEYSLFLFIYLPLLALIMAKKITKPFFFSLGKQFVATGVFYLSIRIVLWFLGKPIVLGQKEVLTQPGILVYLYRAFTTPLRIVAQTFIPQLQLIQMSSLITKLGYPRFITADGLPNPYIVESIVLDLVSYLVGFIIIALSIAAYLQFRRHHEKPFAKALAASLLLIMVSSLPLVLIPGSAGYVSIYEPRYLYLATVGAGLIIILLFTSILRILFPHSWKLTYVGLAVILAPHLWFNAGNIQKDLATLEKRSIIRKSLLEIVQHDYPRLPSKVIFFTESDSAYYGLPPDEQTLPVQSGFGRMLMIWYQKTERFPACMYNNLFLHDLIAQGYRYCDGRGFGYFRSYKKLIEAIKSQDIPIENIIAYSWKSKSETFADMTNDFRRRLLQDTIR